MDERIIWFLIGGAVCAGAVIFLAPFILCRLRKTRALMGLIAVLGTALIIGGVQTGIALWPT